MIKEEFKFTDKLNVDMGKSIPNEINFKVNMRIELRDESGNIKEIRNVHNTVTTAAKNGIMDKLITSPTLGKPTNMELGTGSPAATLLGTYISGTRVALTTKTVLANVLTMVGDWGANVPAAPAAITEAGIFDVVTENTVNMWCSASFAAINKGINDTLKITWTLTGN